MRKDKVASNLLKIAKKLVASKNDMITFPLLNKMKRVEIDFNKPIYTDDMVWGFETFSVETILSNKERHKNKITILVYGFENDPRAKSVWLIDNYDNNGDKGQHVQFCQDIRYALNSSAGIKGWFDPDRVFDGAYDYLEEDDMDKLANHIQLCQNKACDYAKKLADNL